MILTDFNVSQREIQLGAFPDSDCTKKANKQEIEPNLKHFFKIKRRIEMLLFNSEALFTKKDDFRSLNRFYDSVVDLGCWCPAQVIRINLNNYDYLYTHQFLNICLHLGNLKVKLIFNIKFRSKILNFK